MQIKALTDITDIRSRLREYTTLMHREVSASVRQFSVIACRNLANTTQPFSGNEKSVSQAGRMIGEKAVEVDISKVYYVPEVDGGFVKALTGWAEASYRRKRKDKGLIGRQTQRFRKRLNGYISGGNFTAIREMAKDMGWKKLRRTIDPSIHKAARTGKRTKVVKPSGGMTLVLNDKAHLERYILKNQRRVGLAKAGWAKCADLIPTNNKTSATRGIPQWVTRHKRKAEGSIVDHSRDEKNPKVIMTNKIPWASNMITSNEVRKAVGLAKRNFVEYMNRTMKAELRRRAKLKGV
jgi:hypothetical protein